jgi:hypothetical protein
MSAVDGQAQIRFREGEVEREWGIGCDAVADTDDTLRAHLARWRPGAVFLGAKIVRVKDGVVVSDSRPPAR